MFLRCGIKGHVKAEELWTKAEHSGTRLTLGAVCTGGALNVFVGGFILLSDEALGARAS